MMSNLLPTEPRIRWSGTGSLFFDLAVTSSQGQNVPWTVEIVEADRLSIADLEVLCTIISVHLKQISATGWFDESFIRALEQTYNLDPDIKSIVLLLHKTFREIGRHAQTSIK